MGAGNLVLAFGTPENREVLAGTGLVFSTEARAHGAAPGRRGSARRPCTGVPLVGAQARRRPNYSWDAVTDAYLALWASLGSA